MRMDRESEFRDFVGARGADLLRSAYALTRDHGHAEDLVQNTLVRLYVSWERVSRADNPVAYARRVLFNSFARERRRHSVAELPGSMVGALAAPSGAEDLDDRDVLDRALDDLPAAMRAVLVLRYYEDLTVEQAAALLECSVGTVKSRTARALERLRLSPHLDAHEGQGS